ncbi:YjcZ family sporulation protein [Metabacillus sp. BG109]|uniref:YjcZ family sporulation protein n=1 Tax=Metabacillus bambusae TaxID=2795218 RepID=A0ABS3MXP5_9BACI|nr:YjcZ family sporulation protein [Metabacillus bambusae]
MYYHLIKVVNFMGYYGGNSFALIVVLFILLIIVGASFYN